MVRSSIQLSACLPSVIEGPRCQPRSPRCRKEEPILSKQSTGCLLRAGMLLLFIHAQLLLIFIMSVPETVSDLRATLISTANSKIHQILCNLILSYSDINKL